MIRPATARFQYSFTDEAMGNSENDLAVDAVRADPARFTESNWRDGMTWIIQRT